MAKHILIIDDDPVLRRLFGAALASAGFEVIYAPDGNTGREMARRLSPDLILLDIMMPKTDGYVIARRLSEEKQTKDIPVVFLTNQDLSIEAQKAVKEKWVVAYIHKSTDLDEVVKQVKEIIKLRGSKREEKDKLQKPEKKEESEKIPDPQS